MEKKNYMERAIALAKKGWGHVSPNPLVGAVIVKNNEIIGEGFHEKYGDKHAEVNAIEGSKEDTEASTLYVTLEPCCHEGKQPPCVEAIIKAGITKVIVGSRDPNPLVSGKGIEILRSRGIEVIEDYLKDECDELNEVFFHYIKKKTPYVVMKYAMTLDGKIASHLGDSRWITGEESRLSVHEDRTRFKAIMVGVETVIRDDPRLTSRIDNAVNPIRIICDSHLRTPLISEIVKTSHELLTIIVTLNEDTSKWKPYEKAGCRVILGANKNLRIDLNKLMVTLGSMGIDSLLLEGGGTLNYSAIEGGIVNKVKAYIAPKIIGGCDSKSPVEGPGIDRMKDAIVLKNIKIKSFGEDIMMEGEI